MKKRVGLIGAAVLIVALSARAGDETNLLATLRNVGFEGPSIITGAKPGDEPENWFFFCSDNSRNVGITDARKRSGMQSLLFKAQTPAEAYEGFAQKFAVVPNGHYTFSAWILNDPQDPMSAGGYGQVSIEWKDAKEVEISRTYSREWSKESSSERWEKFSIEDDAPTNAAVGIAVITFFCRDSAGVGGFFVDECELTRR
jgi:hypothetical protein